MDEQEREQVRAEVEQVIHGPGRQAQQRAQEPLMVDQSWASHIHHVIGVISGKGGVGKSLVAAALAIGLARQGSKVGILDADVTGPSIPRMLGLANQRATAVEDLLVPVTTEGGIEVMSANLVLAQETDPVLWRGPVMAGAIRQFWGECAWGALDYLIVDMPPGTGDIALTVFQSIPVDGVVIVSSPQDLVQMIVGKAVNMAQTMCVPVLGIVENMAYVKCPHCGEKLSPFGSSRLEQTAETFEVEALDQLPIESALAMACDKGTFERDLPQGYLPKTVECVVNVADLFDALRSGGSSTTMEF